MEILTDEFRVIKPYCQRKCLGDSLMFFIDHVCRLQESNIILGRKEIDASGIIGQRQEFKDVLRDYLRDHVCSHATVCVRIHQVDDSIYNF
jgi:hypothetical protein